MSATALCLLAAIIVVRGRSEFERSGPGGAGINNKADHSIGLATFSSHGSKKKETSREITAPSALNAVAPKLEWDSVESTDYKEYAANLRALGFPEELVRAIVTADVNKHYEARELPLRAEAAPFDAPVSRRQQKITEEELARMRQLREVQEEKQQVLKEILGVYVPRETLTTPTARNYIAYEYALNLLPEEKRDAAQKILEDEWFVDDINKYLGRAEYVEAYKLTRQERNDSLRAVLTEEEFRRFEMNSNPAGTELARRTIGMEPTADEFPKMFDIAWDHWVETGGVGGLWRAVPVPRADIAEADARMALRMHEVLGPERYLDYQMATSEMGQQMRNLAARYDVPRELLAPAFQLQTEIDRRRGADNEELQRQMAEILGPVIYQAWIDGRSQRIKLEP